MPKGRKLSRVPEIFEQFIAGLGQLIKDKVSESVAAATNDFFNTKLGGAPQKAEKPVKKGRKGRRRGRPKGSKNKTKAPAKPQKTEEKPAQA